MSDQVSTPQSGSEAVSSPAEGSANTEVAQTNESPSEAPKEPSKETSKKYEVKIDGNLVTVDEDELLSGYMKAKAATERFQKAATEKKEAERLRKEADERLNKMKTDPWSVLKEMGLDPRKVSEEYLIEQLKLDAMTPEQKQALADKSKSDKDRADLEARLKAYEEKEAKDKEEAEKKQVDELSKKYAQEYEQEFIEALKPTNLPKNARTVAMVADKMYQAMQEGYELSAKQAAKLVEKELKEVKAALLADMDAETLAAFLGEDQIKKLRKRDAEKVKNPTPTQPAKAPEPKPKDDAPQSPEEWLRQIKKKHNILT